MIVAWLLAAWVWEATILYVVAVWLGPDQLGRLILRLARRRRHR